MVGATPSQKASWAAALCIGMALSSFFLSWRYRMPMITAWSTPGAVLIATSAGGVTYENALGAFVVAGLLMVAAGLVKPLERAIEKIPAPIAAAMLAGVLLHYTLQVPEAALAAPLMVLPLVVVFFGLRMSFPLYAVPVVVVLGIALAAFSGSFRGQDMSFGVTALEWVDAALRSPDHPVDRRAAVPRHHGVAEPAGLRGAAGLGLPAAGAARTAGDGTHLDHFRALRKSCGVDMQHGGDHRLDRHGPDCHPDPNKRWLVAWPYLVLYGLIGLMAASFVHVLGALPKELIKAIAGLALFSPLMGGVTAMMKEPRDIESALLTFLVTASGLSILGVGSAFWACSPDWCCSASGM